jgi:YfiH family protein
VTAEPGELLIIRTADCLPILVAAELFGEPVAVAAIHAGWRGLVAGVIETALARLEQLAPAARLRAALGPAIGPCCFEIGPEVASALAESVGAGVLRPGRGDRSHADLPAAARLLLEMREVRVGEGAPPCTRCEPERFHSHRAAGSEAGRMAAFIGLDAE